MALPTGVGSWSSFWRKFKGIFKHVAKKAATSGMVKDALNSQYPGAGDAAQKGMKLIDSASSGNKQALAQVKGIADAVASGDTSKQSALDLLSTLNDAKKEAKAETVTAAVGATMAAGIESLVGRYFKITEKKDGKAVSVVLKITAVHPEAYVQYEAVGMPGMSEWKPLTRIYEAMLDKTAAWTDEKGTPVAVGAHHGHGGGFPQGVMIPYGGAYDPYPYPGADPWMFEEMAQYGAGALFQNQELLGRCFKLVDGFNDDYPDNRRSFVRSIQGISADMDTGIESVEYALRGSATTNRKKIPVADLLYWISNGMVYWVDLDGKPVSYSVGGGGGGGHHGGHGGGGFRTFDPRDMYWGPRIDVDDDGQPILVGHHHGGGGRRGWGGFGAPYLGPGMWYPPMWEEVEIVSDEDIAAEKQAKKEAK